MNLFKFAVDNMKAEMKKVPLPRYTSCLRCHAGDEELFNGLCAACTEDAEKHLALHTEDPDEWTPDYIL